MSGVSGLGAPVAYQGSFRSVTASGDLVTAAENVNGALILAIGWRGKCGVVVGGRPLSPGDGATSTAPLAAGLAPLRVPPGQAVTVTFSGTGRAWCKVDLG